MQTLWKSKTNLPLKRRLFVATVESVLLYGSEAWTLNVKQQKSLDGTYTRMLRKAFNIKWQEHVTNKEVYGKLPLVSSKIKARRMKMAGHCVRRTACWFLFLPSHEDHNRSSTYQHSLFFCGHDLLYLEMVPTESGGELRVQDGVHCTPSSK